MKKAHLTQKSQKQENKIIEKKRRLKLCISEKEKSKDHYAGAW